MTKQKLNNGNYAAIDIGSNAVRLLIKRISIDREGLTASKEQLLRVPLRLGADVFTEAKISKKRAKKLVSLIRAFADIMDIYDVLDYKACATSAIRDAENGKQVIALIKKKTGIKIHILSGKEEAQLIYNTHSEFLQDRRGNFLYVDVGGGSTEINLMIRSTLVFSNSYDIGTIRVLSHTVDPEEWKRMESDLERLARTYSDIDILGTGGNINKLYRLVDHRDKQLQRMPVQALGDIHRRMVNLSLEERVQVFRLKYDRAEVIVPASQVFLTIAERVHAQYIYVPTVGLVDGIIDGLVFKKINHLRKETGEISDALPQEDFTREPSVEMLEDEWADRVTGAEGADNDPDAPTDPLSDGECGGMSDRMTGEISAELSEEHPQHRFDRLDGNAAFNATDEEDHDEEECLLRRALADEAGEVADDDRLARC